MLRSLEDIEHNRRESVKKKQRDILEKIINSAAEDNENSSSNMMDMGSHNMYIQQKNNQKYGGAGAGGYIGATGEAFSSAEED